MESFTDTEGRQWNLSVNVTTVERVRADCKVDLLELAGDGKSPESSLAYQMFADPILLARVVWSLVRPQAEALNITVEQFGEAMAGEALEEATEGLIAETVNFTPNRRDREQLRKMLAMMNRWKDRGRDVIDQRLEDPATEKMLEAELTKLESSFGNSPESPESTPAL